jgi:hypothetical protein
VQRNPIQGKMIYVISKFFTQYGKPDRPGVEKELYLFGSEDE